MWNTPRKIQMANQPPRSLSDALTILSSRANQVSSIPFVQKKRSIGTWSDRDDDDDNNKNNNNKSLDNENDGKSDSQPQQQQQHNNYEVPQPPEKRRRSLIPVAELASYILSSTSPPQPSFGSFINHQVPHQLDNRTKSQSQRIAEQPSFEATIPVMSASIAAESQENKQQRQEQMGPSIDPSNNKVNKDQNDTKEAALPEDSERTSLNTDTIPQTNPSPSSPPGDSNPSSLTETRERMIKTTITQTTPKQNESISLRDMIQQDLQRYQILQDQIQQDQHTIQELRQQFFRKQVELWGVYQYGLQQISTLNDLADSPDAILPGNM